jgi:Bacterial Ig domain
VTAKPPVRIALAVALTIALALVPSALAGKGGPKGGGGGSCTAKNPGVVVDNNWQWGSPGSFGLPGQQLTYAIDVINYDAGCGSSTFAVSVSAPSGFSVSVPTSTITLRSGSSGYLWAYVASPSGATDGDYPITVTVQRTGSTDSASTTSWYKVYSSDSVGPTLYWPSPADGATVTGRSYNLAVSSNDDHAVKNIDLYLDGAYAATKACDDVSYSCSLNYSWATSAGTHTATFKAYDWMGNASTMTTTFTAA